MEHRKYTPDIIRAFLKGYLPADEAEAFRRRMAEDPALEEEVALARLLIEGLKEIERQKRRRRVAKWIAGSLAVAAMVVFVAVALKIRLSRKDKPAATLFSLQGVSIAWNNAEQIVIGGQFQDSLSLGPFSRKGFGAQDFFLAAGNSSSEFHWVKVFGSPAGNDYIEKIALDSKGNIAVTGGLFDQARIDGRMVVAKGKADRLEGDFFIAQFDPAGRLLWLDHAGGIMVPDRQTGANMGTAVAIDPSDQVIATGMYIGSPEWGGRILPVGGPNEDLYLVKYTRGGQPLWVRTVTCDYNIFANAITTDRQGNIYLTGFFGHHNLGGQADFGDTTLRSFGGRDIFTAKYSPEGRLIWVRQAGSPNLDGRDYGQGIAIDDAGHCVITGWVEGKADFGGQSATSRGGRDIFLAKYDAMGNLLWAKTMGGAQNDQGNAVCTDPDGNIYCTGYFTGKAYFDTLSKTSAGKSDIFIAKFDRGGHLLWVKQTGGAEKEAGIESAHDISINETGMLVVTGVFSGSLQVDRQNVPYPGTRGLLMLFFDRQGTLVGIRKIA